MIKIQDVDIYRILSCYHDIKMLMQNTGAEEAKVKIKEILSTYKGLIHTKQTCRYVEELRELLIMVDAIFTGDMGSVLFHYNEVVSQNISLRNIVEFTFSSMCIARVFSNIKVAANILQAALERYPDINNVHNCGLQHEMFFAYYNVGNMKKATEQLKKLNTSYDKSVKADRLGELILNSVNKTYAYYALERQDFEAAKLSSEYLSPSGRDQMSELISKLETDYKLAQAKLQQEKIAMATQSHSIITEQANEAESEAHKLDKVVHEEHGRELTQLSIESRQIHLLENTAAPIEPGIPLPGTMQALAGMIALEPHTIRSLSHKVVNLYFNHLKAEQHKENLLDLRARCTHDGKWIIRGHEYVFRDVEDTEVCRIEQLPSYYMAIDTEYNAENIVIFQKALHASRIARAHGQDGVKFIGGVVELKALAAGDDRLYTSEIYRNSHNEVLVLFNKHGNHAKVQQDAIRCSLNMIDLAPMRDVEITTPSQTGHDIEHEIARIDAEYLSILGSESMLAVFEE